MSADVARVGDVATRYASALYELADERGVIDAVVGDLSKLQTMISASNDFERFIKSPILSRSDQSKGIAAIAVRAGLEPITTSFLGLVAAIRRLSVLPSMIIGIRAILADRRGETTAYVTSAIPLSEPQTASLVDTLKKAIGRNIDVATKVDPSILGGLIVKVGSHMVDSSLKSKLQRLKLAMKGVG